VCVCVCSTTPTVDTTLTTGNIDQLEGDLQLGFKTRSSMVLRAGLATTMAIVFTAPHWPPVEAATGHLSTAAVTVPTVPGYTHLVDVDCNVASCETIKRLSPCGSPPAYPLLPRCDPTVLAALCEDLAGCAGFNTNG
jgi:hypothetical protein